MESRSAPAQYPEKELDDAVLAAIRSRALDKDYLTNLIFGLQRREKARSDFAIEELPSLQSRVSAAEAAAEGLGASIPVAPSLQQDPLFQKNLRRAADELELARARLTLAIGAADGMGEVSEATILHFRTQMISLLEDENRVKTKIYLSSIIERVEVRTTEIRIEGHANDLRKAAVASDESSGGSGGPEVRRYVRRWRRG